MLNRMQAETILRDLLVLPSERVAEVQDFVSFLKDRYGKKKLVDDSSSWSEEDLRDLTAAVMQHADQSL